jgi:MerC mercury resistance protein
MSRPSVSISRIDRLGAGVSFLRAIHCAVLLFAATVLPLLGFGFLADERVEQMFLLTSIALASASVCWGNPSASAAPHPFVIRRGADSYPDRQNSRQREAGNRASRSGRDPVRLRTPGQPASRASLRKMLPPLGISFFRSTPTHASFATLHCYERAICCHFVARSALLR